MKAKIFGVEYNGPREAFRDWLESVENFEFDLSTPMSEKWRKQLIDELKKALNENPEETNYVVLFVVWFGVLTGLFVIWRFATSAPMGVLVSVVWLFLCSRVHKWLK